MESLRPLLFDTVPSIQQNAAFSLGKLANYSQEVAEQIISLGILNEVVSGLTSPDHYYQKHCCFVIRTVSKHSAELAGKVVQAGTIPKLVKCLEHPDIKVREAAAWAIGFIASHSLALADSVVNHDAVPSLIKSIQTDDINLKRLAVSALGDISQHSPDLAKAVIDADGISNISPLFKENDPKLRQYVCSTLSQVAKHSIESAEVVIESHIFPEALHCLKDKDVGVRKSSAALIREIVKHTQEQAQIVINNGGGLALVQYLRPEAKNEPLNAIMAIGYISSFSESLALSLIHENAPDICLKTFVTTKIQAVRAATAWALGQMGKHSPDHASKLTKFNVLELLLAAYLDATATEEVQEKTKRALKLIIENSINIEALQPLISTADRKSVV